MLRTKAPLKKKKKKVSCVLSSAKKKTREDGDWEKMRLQISRC